MFDTLMQEAKMQEVAQEIGEERLLVIRPDWSRIVQDVISVDLDIKYWRGETKLRQEDLGLEEIEPEYRDFFSKNIVLGRKRLMPAQYHRELRGIESRARDLLSRYSYPSGWGHLMPKKAYPEWKALILPLREHFYGLRDELAARREQIVEEMRQEYTQAAKAAWKVKSLSRTRSGSLRDWLDPEAPQDFVEEFVRAVVGHIPTAQAIYDSFFFDWTPAYIATPAELEAELVQAERIRLGREELLEVEDLDWQKKRLELDAAKSRLREEEALDREIRSKAAETRERKIDATLDQISGQLRQMIYEVSVDALAAIENSPRQTDGSPFLPGRSAAALRNLVSQVRRLNFMDDAEVERCVHAIEEVAVDRKAGERDIADITRTLRQVGVVTRGELLSLGRSPRSARALEIPDRIDEAAVRRVRRELVRGERGEVLMLPLRGLRRCKGR